MFGTASDFFWNMENGFDGGFATSCVLAGCAVALIVCQLLRGGHEKGKKWPPGPPGVPLLGYLPFLSSEPYRDLHRMGEKYGGVFGLRVGRTYVVILADFPALKAALGQSTTTDRPETAFDFIPDGVGFSSVNGEEWAEQRRYCMRAMRNVGLGRDRWERLVQSEVSDFIRLISKQDGRPFDVGVALTASVSNNISALVFGKRLPLDDALARFLSDSIYASSQFAPQIGWRSAFPALMDALARMGLLQDKAEGLGKLVEFNRFVRQQVSEHGGQQVEENADDFINGYLQKIKENREGNLGNSFNETNLYGNIQALFIGASDTTRTSLYWLLVTIATYQDTQNRVQAELDRVLGAEGEVRWAERASLPLTWATLMEGQRWKTVAPFNTGRVAMEDIKIGGYDIPKGTTIIANNWGVHHDAKYWTNPEDFRPERFLSEDGEQVNFKPESYVPFSYGKRNCPGETVAMMEILFYFAAILRKFRVLPPEGKQPDLRGTLGLTFQAVPQELRFVARTMTPRTACVGAAAVA